MSYYSLYINSKDRQEGDANNFRLPITGFLKNIHVSSIQLRSCTIPNAVPTIMSNVNNTPTINGATTYSIPAGYYAGSTFTAAVQTLLSSYSTGTTVSLSTLTNCLTINVGASPILFDQLPNQSSTLQSKKNQSERFLEVAGMDQLYTTTASNSFPTLGTTLAASTTYYALNPLRLNGTNYVELMTDLQLPTFHTGRGNDNVFARIPLSGSNVPTVTSWEAGIDDVGFPVISSVFETKFYLQDEWGDLFYIPSSMNVQYHFRLTSAKPL